MQRVWKLYKNLYFIFQYYLMKIIDGHKKENIHFEWNKDLKPIEFIENNEIVDVPNFIVTMSMPDISK